MNPSITCPSWRFEIETFVMVLFLVLHPAQEIPRAYFCRGSYYALQGARWRWHPRRMGRHGAVSRSINENGSNIVHSFERLNRQVA